EALARGLRLLAQRVLVVIEDEWRHRAQHLADARAPCGPVRLLLVPGRVDLRSLLEAEAVDGGVARIDDVLCDPAPIDPSSARDRALRNEARFGVTDAHARAHELAHPLGEQLALLHLAELARAAVRQNPDLALVQLVVEGLRSRPSHPELTDPARRPRLAAPAVFFQPTQAEARADEVRFVRREGDVRATELELTGERVVADAETELLRLSDQELALHQAVEHRLSQAEVAGRLRIEAARGDETVRRGVLLAIDAVAVEADGTLLREPRRERSAPCTELDDEDQDDG